MNGTVNTPDEDVGQRADGSDALVLWAPGPGTPADVVCRRCCHWSSPLRLTGHLAAPCDGSVPLHFEEWLIWHLHTVQHQQGAPTVTLDPDCDQVLLMILRMPRLCGSREAA